MIILEKKDYVKGIETVKQIKINHLFARAVLEDHVNGIVYTDDPNNPKTFYSIHPYGISMLFGDSENENFNSKFIDYLLNTAKTRNRIEWMQAFPEAWHKKLKELLGNNLIKSDNHSEIVDEFKVVEYTRVNFKFNIEKYRDFKNKNLKEKYSIKRTDKAMYEIMSGTVIPKYFWNNANQFCEKGIGFSLIIDDKPASTAYSAFVFADKLEIGIETDEKYRGKGFAMYTCSSLIDYCIEKNLEPIWACRLENTGSYLLAQKLGFEPSTYTPFYKVNT